MWCISYLIPFRSPPTDIFTRAFYNAGELEGNKSHVRALKVRQSQIRVKPLSRGPTLALFDRQEPDASCVTRAEVFPSPARLHKASLEVFWHGGETNPGRWTSVAILELKPNMLAGGLQPPQDIWSFIWAFRKLCSFSHFKRK